MSDKKIFCFIIAIIAMFFCVGINLIYADDSQYYEADGDIDILAPDTLDLFKDFKRVKEEDLDIIFDDIPEEEDFEKKEEKPDFLTEELNALEDNGIDNEKVN